MPRQPSPRRAAAAAGLAVIVAAGLLVHGLVPDCAASDIAGDALYAAAAYFAVVAVLPRTQALVVGTLAAAWCIAVELFQLTGIPLTLGAAFPPAMLVLGTVFDPRDLLVYVIMVAVVTAVDGAASVAVRRRRARRGSRG